MTDDEFDSIYEESKCDGSRDKIIAYLFDQRKALLATLSKIDDLAEYRFTQLHGPKLDGPRNDTERTLLEISDLCTDALNTV